MRATQLWLSEDLRRLYWARSRPVGSLAALLFPAPRELPVSDVVELSLGKCTELTLATGDGVPAASLLSLRCMQRTIDLCVPPSGNGLTRDQWAALFSWLLHDVVRTNERTPLSLAPLEHPSAASVEAPPPPRAVTSAGAVRVPAEPRGAVATRAGPSQCGRGVASCLSRPPLLLCCGCGSAMK